MSKPRIYNRNTRQTRIVFDNIRDNPDGTVTPFLNSWVLEYRGEDWAYAATQPQAIDELVRLQWAGRIPEPGRY